MALTLNNPIIDDTFPLETLGGPSVAFSRTLEALRVELSPSNLVESLIVDQVVLAVSRLRTIVDGTDMDPESAGALQSTAEQSLYRALDALRSIREHRFENWGRPAPPPSPFGDHSEGPSLSVDTAPVFEMTHDDAGQDPGHGHWRDRLVFDETISDDSPVIRGTWITTGQIVSLMIDGLTSEDILLRHPEITEEDIRACLAYTVEQDGPIKL